MMKGGGEMESRSNSSKVVKAARVLKACLRVASWAVTVLWFVFWATLLTSRGKTFQTNVANVVNTSKFWGKNASQYILYTGPVIALAILALLYLELDKRFPEKRRSGKKQPSALVRAYRAMWTQPIVVRSPLGILTFIDLVIIFVVLFYVIWMWSENIHAQFAALAAKPTEGLHMWQRKLDKSSLSLGLVLPFTIALLFLPVTRGSPILRMVNVPFEHAVKYHRWIGNLTVLLVAVHGILYGAYYGVIHEVHRLAEWSNTGISNVAGVISAVAGIVMAFTSLPYVRARFFNVFYNMHHLYVVFFVFYAWHIGWSHMGQSMGPIFLFFVDRFLRMVQSLGEVTGVSARVLPSGVVELKIPKQQGLTYSALSFLYVNIPSISRLEWHPFSTTSSSLDARGSKEFLIVIKPLGDWTQRLHTAVITATKPTSNSKVSQCPFAMKVHVEGPYGHQSNYYLRYKNLILVAGGVGVTPFLAILRDLLKRHEIGEVEALPTNIQLIWCVRRSHELATLRGIQPSKIYSSYGREDSNPQLVIDVNAYITGEPEQPEDRTTASTMKPEAYLSANFEEHSSSTTSPVNPMAALSSNDNLWIIALIVACLAGFVLVSGLFHQYVFNPNDKPNIGKPFLRPLEVFLFFVSMLIGIVVCGGAVILFWIATKMGGTSNGGINVIQAADDDLKMHQMANLEGNHEEESLLDRNCIITEGSRPNFQDTFDAAATKYEGEEIGVLACGPQGLQESVASQCCSQNFKSHWKTQFHFHSVNFDL